VSGHLRSREPLQKEILSYANSVYGHRAGHRSAPPFVWNEPRFLFSGVPTRGRPLARCSLLTAMSAIENHDVQRVLVASSIPVCLGVAERPLREEMPLPPLVAIPSKR
jgi:hypothetical protein